jgi:HAD superfamily hydrolase (TIGR01509 family)
MPTAVVFDMDGLLFDTEALYQKAMLAAAAEGGHDVGAAAALTIGVPWHVSRVIFRDSCGPGFPVDAFMTSWVQRFKVIAETELALKPGVVELLDLLDDLKLPRAIATSSAHATVQDHLAAHGLEGRFHQIVAHGDYAASKPAPDPFRMAAERLGVEPASCLALEDSYNGVRSAASAGMMTVMVPDLLEATDEMRGLCTMVATDLHEVRDMLLRRAALRY